MSKKSAVDKTRVIDVAAELADSEGLENLTLTKIANKLGVHQPALYRHVANYQDVVRELGLRGREVLRADLAHAAIGMAGDDAVAAIGRAWRTMAKSHPGMYEATDRFPCSGDDQLEAAVENIVAVIGQALTGFALDAVQRVHAARALRAAFHGFVHLELGDGYPHPEDLEETFEGLIELLCAGIRSQTNTVD